MQTSSDMTTVHKTDRRVEHQSPVVSGEEEIMMDRRIRRRASDTPSQFTTSTDHYLEIIETSSNEVDETASHRDQEEPANVDDVYDSPETSYEGLDHSTVVNRGRPPEPSVYSGLMH